MGWDRFVQQSGLQRAAKNGECLRSSRRMHGRSPCRESRSVFGGRCRPFGLALGQRVVLR